MGLDEPVCRRCGRRDWPRECHEGTCAYADAVPVELGPGTQYGPDPEASPFYKEETNKPHIVGDHVLELPISHPELLEKLKVVTAERDALKADVKRLGGTLGEKMLEKVDGALKTLSAVEDSREAYHKELVAENEKLREDAKRQTDLAQDYREDNRKLRGAVEDLRALFAEDRSYDDKSILDHMDIAGVLLHNKCGEVGFVLSNKFSGWIKKAQAVISGKA